MSKEEFVKIQTCVLKVNIHCDGCKQKVKKILHKIEGVYTTVIDSDLGKVTVSGNVDSATLIKKLNKNGKFAENWGGMKVNHNQVINQTKNPQIGNNNSNNKNQTPVKGVIQNNPAPVKVGVNDKNQKSVNFDLAEVEGLNDEDFESDDDFDEDDEFEDDKLMGNPQGMPNLMMNNMLNSAQQGILKKPVSGGNNPVKFNPAGGNANGNAVASAGKKSGGGNGNSPNGGAQNQGGKNGGGPGVENKKDRGGGEQNKAGNHGGAPGGSPIMKNPMVNGAHGMSNMMSVNASGVGPMPNMAMAHMGPPSFPAVVVSGTGYQIPGNPYQQQQQYAAMMMNMQRVNGNERFQPMVYARPSPAVNYMPSSYPHYPSSSPFAGDDEYTMFSDENTESCSIM